jgi:hypothetical protein
MGIQVERPAMESWYMDSSNEDQRLPHHLDPPKYVTYEELASICLSVLLSYCILFLPQGFVSCRINCRFCVLLFEIITVIHPLLCSYCHLET